MAVLSVRKGVAGHGADHSTAMHGLAPRGTANLERRGLWPYEPYDSSDLGYRSSRVRGAAGQD